MIGKPRTVNPTVRSPTGTPPLRSSDRRYGKFVGSLAIVLNFSMKTNVRRLSTWFNIYVYKSGGAYVFHCETEQSPDLPGFEEYDYFDIYRMHVLFGDETDLVEFKAWMEQKDHRVWDDVEFLEDGAEDGAEDSMSDCETTDGETDEDT